MKRRGHERPDKTVTSFKNGAGVDVVPGGRKHYPQKTVELFLETIRDCKNMIHP